MQDFNESKDEKVYCTSNKAADMRILSHLENTANNSGVIQPFNRLGLITSRVNGTAAGTAPQNVNIEVGNVNFLHVFCASAECNINYLLQKKTYDEQIRDLNKNSNWFDIDNIKSHYVLLYSTASCNSREIYKELYTVYKSDIKN